MATQGERLVYLETIVPEIRKEIKGISTKQDTMITDFGTIREEIHEHFLINGSLAAEIETAVKNALPNNRREDKESMKIGDKVGWFFRTFSKQVNLLIWLVFSIITGTLYISYSEEISSFFELVKNAKHLIPK